MKLMRALALTSALMLGGTGVANAAQDAGDGGSSVGPTCYGSAYSYHVWNLFHPMEVYGVDSCTVNVMLAYRAAGGTFGQFLAAMSAAKWPAVGVPASVLMLFWNSQTDMMRICAAPGRGVELVVSNLNGQVISCSAQ